LAVIMGGLAGWMLIAPADPLLAVMALGTAFVCMTGMVEDTRGVPTLARLCLQALAALLVVNAGGSWKSLAVGPLSMELSPIVGGIFTILWIIWVTNLYNFMDGVNGIAAMQGLVLCAGLGTLGHQFGSDALVASSLCLAGGLLGFLPFNFPRARIFMGDAGSLPLGFLFAVLPLFLHVKAEGDFSFIHGALVLGPFLLDASITLVRRMLRGERIYEAHRTHFYQSLADLLASHSTTTLIYAGLATGFVVAVAYDVRSAAAGASSLLLALIAVTLGVFAAIALLHRRKFGK
jgi:UDP-N-acetylmuramyl pentapeptide phosphotransferase/UDP-N-acetylglucosamine-1-phosphate transferase